MTGLPMCGATRHLKIRYHDQAAAQVALEDVREIRRKGRNIKGHRAEQRVYECWACGGWHLTSQKR